MKKRIAIIPARGGSKRIPRKNIKDFLGKPIIAYSIEAALASGLFDEVMVSTDDDEIAKVAVQYGAKVPFKRSAENSNDFAGTADVLVEVLNEYEKRGQFFDKGCCIYATAPFVTAALLTRGYNLLEKEAYETVFPVLQYSFPIQRALKINGAKRVEMFQPEYMFTRSQDLEPAYHDSGQFYWFLPNVLLEKKKVWTDNTGVLVLPEMAVQDIDTPADWEVAEFKYRIHQDGKT